MTSSWPHGSVLPLPPVNLPSEVFYGRDVWMLLRPSALDGTLCLQFQSGNEEYKRKIDVLAYPTTCPWHPLLFHMAVGADRHVATCRVWVAARERLAGKCLGSF